MSSVHWGVTEIAASLFLVWPTSLSSLGGLVMVWQKVWTLWPPSFPTPSSLSMGMKMTEIPADWALWGLKHNGFRFQITSNYVCAHWTFFSWVLGSSAKLHIKSVKHYIRMMGTRLYTSAAINRLSLSKQKVFYFLQCEEFGLVVGQLQWALPLLM